MDIEKIIEALEISLKGAKVVYFGAGLAPGVDINGLWKAGCKEVIPRLFGYKALEPFQETVEVPKNEYVLWVDSVSLWLTSDELRRFYRKLRAVYGDVEIIVTQPPADGVSHLAMALGWKRPKGGGVDRYVDPFDEENVIFDHISAPTAEALEAAGWELETSLFASDHRSPMMVFYGEIKEVASA